MFRDSNNLIRNTTKHDVSLTVHPQQTAVTRKLSKEELFTASQFIAKSVSGDDFR